MPECGEKFGIIGCMVKLFTSGKIYIAKSKIKNAGRGVFAGRDIEKGEVVERCPVVEVPKNDVSNFNDSYLVQYFFYFGKKKERLMLVLGFGSIYNHSDKPNLTFRESANKGCVDFISITDIKKNSELTFDYYHSALKKDKRLPLWFEE